MRNSRIHLVHIAMLASLAVLLAACSMGSGGQTGETPTPTQSSGTGEESTVTPSGTSSDSVITGTASVDTIDVSLLESMPVQVNVLVKGNLPDGCTTIGTINQSLDGNTIMVDVPTIRPTDQMCTTALVPYEQVVSLDVKGLKAGTYTVNVNGVTATFELQQDNP